MATAKNKRVRKDYRFGDNSHYIGSLSYGRRDPLTDLPRTMRYQIKLVAPNQVEVAGFPVYKGVWDSGFVFYNPKDIDRLIKTIEVKFLQERIVLPKQEGLFDNTHSDAAR